MTTSTPDSSTEFEPLSDAFRNNVYGTLNEMRERCRAYRHKGTMQGVVSVFRHADVVEMAQDWKTWSSDRGPEFKKSNLGDATIIFYDDPPEHTRLRAVIAPLFLPANVQPLAHSIESRCDELLDECFARGEFDLVEDLASGLTIYMISKLLGLPEDAFSSIRHWAEVLEENDGLAVFWPERRPEVEQHIAATCTEMSDYFRSFVEERKTEDKGDVMSAMVQGGFSDKQASGLCQLLCIAGQATTTNLIANVFRLLIENPHQARLVHEDSGYIDPLIEESLRLHSQIRKLERIAKHDFEIDGVEIKKGDFVALWLASAKRDPRVIERPDEFDITRSKIRHLAFGTGIHMCIGNALARLETRILLRRFFARVKEYGYAKGPEDVVYGANAAMDGIVRLPLRVQ